MDWKFWKKKVAEPVQLSLQETLRTAPASAQATLLKKMKWVVHQQTNKIGIITAMDTSGMVQIDLVQADGTTYATCRTQVGNVRIAKLDEIPLCRRPTNPAMAANLGYF